MTVLLTGYEYDPDPELTQKMCVYLFLLLCCTSLATTITPPPACLSPYHHHTSTSSFIHDLSCCSRWCRKSLLKSHFFIIFTSPELPYCLLYMYACILQLNSPCLFGKFSITNFFIPFLFLCSSYAMMS